MRSYSLGYCGEVDTDGRSERLPRPDTPKQHSLIARPLLNPVTQQRLWSLYLLSAYVYNSLFESAFTLYLILSVLLHW